MTVHSIQATIVVSRPPARRLADALRQAWQAWLRRREAQRTLDLLVALDDHTLRDIGASAELRAYAEAQQGGAYERMAGLLR